MEKLSHKMDKNLKMVPRADKKKLKMRPRAHNNFKKWDLKSVVEQKLFQKDLKIIGQLDKMC